MKNPGNQSNHNPYVFVVGCPRSGTTLLQRMLHSHPQLAVAYDTLFIPQVVRREKDKNPPVTPELVRRVREFRRFSRFGLPDDIPDRLADGAADYRELVCRIYDAYAAMHGKPYGGEKSPGYVRHMPLLQSLFPRARFIHLVRDGRNVALSLMDWGRQKKAPKGPARKYRLWQESPAAVSALWWSYKADRGRNDAQKLNPGSYLEVSYEALVAAPEPQLHKMARFLELPYADEMVNFHEGKTKTGPGLSAKAAWLPATKGIRDWRRSMDPADLELFEALAGDSLAAFGYELHFQTISPGVLEQAETYRRKWREELG